MSALTCVIGLVALVVLAIVRLFVRRIPPVIPLSPFAARWRVGIDFFERIGAMNSIDAPAGGLVDALSDLARPGLDVGDLHPALHAFFCQTGSHELLTRPHWHWGFRPLRPLVTALCRAIGQFDIPVRDAWIHTRVFALDADRDPRSHLRGVIRTYAGTDRPMQVAAYAVHKLADANYMNCAFPLPGGNLTGILRLDRMENIDGRKQGVSLTSFPIRPGIEDTGVWYVTPRMRVRLPLDETLSFWPAGSQPFTPPADLDTERMSVIGEHVMRLFGLPFITSRYFIRPSTMQRAQ